MYTQVVRPLTDREERHLRRCLARIPVLRRSRLWAVAGGISAALWVLTVLASKRVLWPTVVWVSLAVVLVLWVGWEERRRVRGRRRHLETLLAANRVEERRVTATEAVALEEIEDLGETWAFQVEPDRILLLIARQDLPLRFPTTDFSHVLFHDPEGSLVDIGYFQLRGERLRPVRRISAENQRGFDLSRTPEILTGRLERLELLLRSVSSGRGGQVVPGGGS